ncbi:nickel pincer cofactor biosynthesis protein LarB [Anoxybacillus geothermalis]|uniref:nickel pincer cofactor biosynthesis protein LarB n=1 Tax=unclassified Geobacillus TaxID=2642459 RepID=UPI000C284D34|nr:MULTISPECIES: nickel pincer cofactor biosynthesis protein LarB [unclassified Geobacillus]MED0653993.1 nickel pincer cofactor biosynthesis protein LarB [Anoxybacillus geothermalis]PJW15705.1 1-(5-phosphoribosyl)-5-amino-4-imidazole-carboxylate carboxylase [Geobacillus sp. Manikaran-105]PJW17221.1 1-(5-phosphoribosyl)-5-amino-4-imidazole-carboxylate carboxylase [Geobacillus sp. WSUCF-018B]WJP99125.1 nickel pincer cofactor biosynthesis protein LarB [Geobacillus stearothermophilus]
MSEVIKETLNRLKEGSISVEEAYRTLASYDHLGYATLDIQRERRKGFPEIIFGEGKSREHLLGIFERLMRFHKKVVATRVDQEKASYLTANLKERYPTEHFEYRNDCNIFYWISHDYVEIKKPGYIAVVSAGTSDFSVAEEAAVTAELLGCEVKRIYDVGVAGIHRLLDKIEMIERSRVVIVVAGMEGALASVVGGLVSKPVIAVPTSVGYGANFRGLSALLTMLNSCASGVSVVNIDNGFGAGYYAATVMAVIEQAVAEAKTLGREEK